MKAPHVTVIIPAYKAVATLEKAVDSVIAQSFADWELLIVEDCSPDETGALADRLAQRDARIRVIHLPANRGKSHAMNQATAQARGSWIAMLDSDDWYAPERLAKLMAVAQDGIDMVTDNQILVDSKADAEAGTALPRNGRNKLIDLDAFLQASDATSSFDYGMLKPVFRADFIRAHQVDYDEQARLGEDYALLLCFFAAGGKALLLDEPLYYYVQPFGTISRQWAQEGRKRYNFEHLAEVNARYLKRLHDKLTPAQRAILQRRGDGIAALARFHQLREAIAARDFGDAFSRLFTAPPPFWQLLARRIAEKLPGKS